MEQITNEKLIDTVGRLKTVESGLIFYWVIGFSSKAIYFVKIGGMPAIMNFPYPLYLLGPIVDAYYISKGRKKFKDTDSLIKEAKLYLRITKDQIKSIQIEKGILSNSLILNTKNQKYILKVGKKKFIEFLKLYEEFKTR